MFIRYYININCIKLILILLNNFSDKNNQPRNLYIVLVVFSTCRRPNDILHFLSSLLLDFHLVWAERSRSCQVFLLQCLFDV